MMGTGTVYLLHLDKPIGDLTNPHGQAQHYLGWAKDLDRRIAVHRSGNGSPLIAAARRLDIACSLARTWPGDRNLERRLKNRHNAKLLCPLCSGKAAYNRAQDKGELS